MKKKEELKFLDKEWEKMNVHLKGFIETGDQEELHKFRVQIKKLRAMLSLFESTSRQHGLLKRFKPVRKIFKYAGHIRDAYTNLQLGKRYQFTNEAFENSQQRLIEDGSAEFRNNGKLYTAELKDSYKALKKQLQRVDNDAIEEFYKRQLEQIAVEFEEPTFTEEMHTSRKKIKILVYNQKLADRALNGSFPFNAGYLDALQDCIGEWHDNVLAVQLFSVPELKDRILISKIKRQNVRVKHAIVKLADDFWHKATTPEIAAAK